MYNSISRSHGFDSPPDPVKHIAARVRRAAREDQTIACGCGTSLEPSYTCCLDCCPDCYELTRPVSQQHGERTGIVLAYRCKNGHDWHTWWARSLAALQHRGNIEEDLVAQAWPPITGDST